jgi:bifunctional DNA-binding transcriptional regulator/antitoxin component of YhaV-PrlF toxin-antitoxin module
MVVLPKEYADELGIEAGDYVSIRLTTTTLSPLPVIAITAVETE